jgi:hypothetical protein
MISVATSSGLDNTERPQELQNLLDSGTWVLQDEQTMNIATVAAFSDREDGGPCQA